MKKIICFLFIFTLYANNYQKFVIGCRPVGFFSNFLGVLTNLEWAIKNNKVPVVYWDKTSLYYQKKESINNAWEYYFERVTDLKYKKDDKIYKEYFSPQGFGIPAWSPDGYNQINKIIFNRIIKKFIKIKKPIQKKINSFYKQYMKGKLNIGIHLRGTDKYTETPVVDPYFILNKALEIAKKSGQKHYQFFIATDENKLLNLAKEKLGNRVVYYNSHRSNNKFPVWNLFSNKKLLGEEVLIEVQLLSKCDYFVHTLSNVSAAVCYFNPNIKNTLLMH